MYQYECAIVVCISLQCPVTSAHFGKKTPDIPLRNPGDHSCLTNLSKNQKKRLKKKIKKQEQSKEEIVKNRNGEAEDLGSDAHSIEPMQQVLKSPFEVDANSQIKANLSSNMSTEGVATKQEMTSSQRGNKGIFIILTKFIIRTY